MTNIDQDVLGETERLESLEGTKQEVKHADSAQTLEGQNEHLVQELQETEQHLEHLSESVANEREHLAKVRADMGLSPATEESPSVLADLAEIALETVMHISEEEKLVEINHAKPAVEAETEKGKEILMDFILEFCRKMPEKDFEHLVETGLTQTGHRVSWPIIGDVTPDIAKIFVRAVKEGKHSFPMEMLRRSGVLAQIEKQLEQRALNFVVDQLRAVKKDGIVPQVVAGIAESVVRAEMKELHLPATQKKE